MNDKVEEIYTQMFAPHPIPQSVIDLYERTVFLGNRIDMPNVSYGGLSIIAAIATKDAKSSVSKPIIPETINIIETVPTQRDVGIEVPAPETTQEPQTIAQRPDTSAQDEHGPMGPMDAPIKPGPQHPVSQTKPTQTKPMRGMSVKRMLRLTPVQLRAHAKKFYGYEPPPSYTKKKIANALKAMTPIIPGAVKG